MAEPLAYAIRCCLTPLRGSALGDAGGRQTPPSPACVDYRVPANDEQLFGPM